MPGCARRSTTWLIIAAVLDSRARAYPPETRPTMLGRQKLMAFLGTSDGERARAFYEGTLGLSVTSDDGFALAVDANGTMLRIQKVGPFEPHPFTSLGWDVKDIEAVVASLQERG